MEDPNQILFQILIILALVLFNAFFAAAEIALVSVRRTRIKQLIEEGDLRAKTVQKLLEKPTSFMATVQIGVTLVGFLASAFAAVSIAQEPTKWLISLGLDKSTANGLAVFAITLIVGFISLVFGEIAPKSLAMQHAEKLALSFAGTINFLSIIALPAVKVVSFFSDLVVRPFGGHVKFSSPILTEEELKMLVEAGEEEGVIEEDEKEMIHSIFDFTDTVVRQVMVPRTDMHSVSITSSLDELLEVIINQGHSRIPVYEENTDNIKGVLYAKDLLVYLKEDKSSFDINRILRPAYFIPETKEVNDLLTEFKRGNIHMAIVRDEYGGTAGLVTVEDLIEEIVGDIRDEYDNAEEPQINYIDENNSIVSARMRVEDVNEQMNIEIPIGEQYDTVGGFVFDLFGKQPEEKEEIRFENLIFVAEEIDSTRINKIKITQLSKEEIDEDQNDHTKSKTSNGNKTEKK